MIGICVRKECDEADESKPHRRELRCRPVPGRAPQRCRRGRRDS